MSPNDDSENDIWDYKPLKKKKKQESPLVTKTVAKRKSTNRRSNKGHTSSPAPSPMPFSILLVQSQSWHVADCLDFCRKSCKECPDGLLCSSSFPNHYRNFNHTLLAQSRANGDVVSPQTTTKTQIKMDLQLQNIPATSQDNFPIHSLRSSPVNNNQTQSSKIPNGLLLLRSPAPQDLKKKKGWSSPKVPKSVSSSQEIKAEIVSTPVTNTRNTQACSRLLKSAPSPLEVDDAISYSPLSEIPMEIEGSKAGPRKTLFDIEPGETKNESSLVAFSDSEDELFTELLDSLDKEEGLSNSLHTQVVSVTSSQQSNQESLNKATYNCEKEKPGSSTSVGSSENSIQSPQSIVLERLRDTILNSERPFCGSCSSQPDKANSEMPLSDKMTPQKSKSKGSESGSLKQTDIGVAQPFLVEGGKQEAKTQKQGRQRKSQATTSAASSHSAVATVENGTQEDKKRTGAKGWKRRTTSTTGDGKYPRCPFYKKIPDNGNLVKHKLRIPEQYVHILPMNTEVIVEGVRVILLDANHCPGAAMLLFVLPDGQTVLHTGDFRADPSMETYPELLSSRVQTLYLDTTYCSPEYTFPKQQEVINYAANTAFELVTLNPRTLVVCGSYSVGKEKVFWISQ
ncbi:hypothetical protein WMY93_010855 [Mugilogobius chulae]|uniref:C2H2-type domain-containing protein n=1 Tax=Mugilogobius chulae TaxID=88201 RepID=A0AAW0PK28_9GOBI